MVRKYDLKSQEFDAIAETWLGIGASSFSYWEHNELIIKWGELRDDSRYISAPIKIHGAVLGELRVGGDFPPYAQKRLQTDAQLISKLLPLEKDRSALAEEMVDIRDQLVALWSLSDQSDLTVNLVDLLKRFVREAVRLVKVDAAFFVISKSEDEYITITYPEQYTTDSSIQELFQKITTKSSPAVYRGHFLKSENNYGASYLIIPFKIENEQNALLGLMKEENEFLYKDIRLGSTIVSHASAQIEMLKAVKLKVELAQLETEMEMAQKIQRSTMPRKLPQVPDLDIWATTFPASHVGGDFYDLIYEPKKTINFAVGDISGKGMPAALLLALTMKVVHDEIIKLGYQSPGQVIEYLNRELHKDFDDAIMFCTLFIGQYFPGSRKFMYANAGQYPIIYAPCMKPVKMLDADTTPIGIFDEISCPSNYVLLEKGDILVLATDGICEATDYRNNLFGFNRLMQLITKELANLSASEIGVRILDEVDKFSQGKSQEDDRTLIVIKAE